MSNISRDQAYERIKNMIVAGELQTGDVTSVNELIEKLDMGRSPIRDAILRLNDEGLVQVVPRKGIFVSGIRSKDIKDLFQLRLAIELFAVERIIEDFNEEALKELEIIVDNQEELAKEGDDDAFIVSDENFHIGLVQLLENKRMNNILLDGREQLSLYGFKALTLHNNAKESMEEHKKILEAIKHKDKETARRELTKHLTRAKNIVLLE
jgi:DNA-binding GntR family transcriptional regulator